LDISYSKEEEFEQEGSSQNVPKM